MQGGNRRILDCIHMFWGCDFCHICGVFISTLDFLIACVAITSLVVWLGSAEGLELHPDEAAKWQTQIDESFIALIIIAETFKPIISLYIPGFDFYLSSLHESLKDIFLFFKDLTK